MRIPTSTYRLQFGPGFGFDQARALVPYLRALGVGDLYASPLLAARPGSRHGYDVVDPTRLNTELGGGEGFERLAGELRAADVGVLLDIVPNHMAASADNPWWWDVLRHGRRSEFASFFDIDWGAGGGQVLAPVLEGPFPAVLEAGEIRLTLSGSEPVVTYGPLRFPVDPRSFEGRPKDLPALNGTPGDPGSFDMLEHLLRRQHYRLADWRVAAREIAYRRFFDISDLVSLRMEDPTVFDAWHALVLELVRRGRVTGLRVDHVDGLLDPGGYLRRLLGSTGPDVFVVVEKILRRDERLQDDWPVAGATGYEFADVAEGLFVDPAGVARLERFAAVSTGDDTRFEDLAARCKLLVLDELFAGEGASLARALHTLSLDDRHGRDLTEDDLRLALAEVTARMAVYRTYTVESPVSEIDRRVVDRAARGAARRVPPPHRRAVDFVRRVLVLEVAPGAGAAEARAWARFVMRWQRLTGPVAAKGVEDTALYRWPGLLSRSEVGSEPARPAVAPGEFHRRMRERQRRRPGSLNAGSTHDSKRSEDVRARLHVLSEVPDEWARRVRRWRRMNRHHVRPVGGRAVPDPAFELHLYQSMVGVWPFHPGARRDLTGRLQEYAVKAAREAKLHTTWLAPDAAYERAVRGWIRAVLAAANAGFRHDLESFVHAVAPAGVVNSLAALVLRATAPGIPDVYQGTELWNLSMVDPDNRRPVDFERLAGLPAELDAAAPGELAASWRDGRIKLHVLRRCLALRRERPELFARGSYVPLEVTGRRRGNVVAFARRDGRSWSVTLVPRLVAGLVRGGRLPVGERPWPATIVHLPARAPDAWTDVLTGEPIRAEDGAVRVAEAFGTFPVAVLVPGR
jgi:(1->4)-alpha-D-glucan 1-alpha-D-glucosylmutase